MTDQPTTYAALADRFPAAAHKTKTIGGRALTYVDGEMVISRLNEVLGIDGWSFEVKDVKVLDDEVWALGRMTVYQGERTIVREQAGGQIINRTKGIPATPYRPAQPADGDRPEIPAVEARPAVKGDITELNNDIKGAITDCIKKCASLVGVGLYLFNPEERLEVEAEMRHAKRPAPTPIRRETPKPEPTPEEQARAEKLVNKRKPLAEQTRPELIDSLKAGVKAAQAKGAKFSMPTDEGLEAMSDAAIQSQIQAVAAAIRAAEKAG
jgi:hypothetical protein